MSNTIKVTYDASSLKTEILVNDTPFDTTRIDGKEIADWVYPFSMRKIKWNGFYSEMVSALNGEKEFSLIFCGDDESLNELKEALAEENASVEIGTGFSGDIIINVNYDENALSTEITINDKPFDAARIQGKEIEDWVYPFTMRKTQWDGFFEEMEKACGSNEYTVQFSGSAKAMKELMAECPETVDIHKAKKKSSAQTFANNEATSQGNDSIADLKGKFWSMDISELLSYVQDDRFNGTLSESDKKELAIACTILFEKYKENDNYAEAFVWIQKAAELGDASAQCELGKIYNFSFDAEKYSIEEDKSEACSWFKKSSAQGYADAQAYMASFFLKGSEAIEFFELAAQQGNSDAMAALARRYYEGVDVKKDYSKAFSYAQKATEKKDKEGILYLGLCYYYGRGVKIDYEKAYLLFLRTSNYDPFARFHQGLCHENGYGVIPNEDKAKACYRLARLELTYFLNSHNMMCDYPLSSDNRLLELTDRFIEMYEEQNQFDKIVSIYLDKIAWQYDEQIAGELNSFLLHLNVNYVLEFMDSDRTEEDEETYHIYDVLRAFYAAARADIAIADYYLGAIFYEGLGIEYYEEPDYARAAEYFEDAARLGDTDAQTRLGDMYLYGKGVLEDEQKAVELFSEAAEDGDIRAITRLADCYHYGFGVKRDLQMARKLYQVAADNDYEDAKEMLEELDNETYSKSNISSIDVKKTYDGTKHIVAAIAGAINPTAGATVKMIINAIDTITE